MSNEENLKLELAFNLVDLMHLMQEAFEEHPHWRKARHTPLENDLAVVAAEVARNHLIEQLKLLK